MSRDDFADIESEREEFKRYVSGIGSCTYNRKADPYRVRWPHKKVPEPKTVTVIMDPYCFGSPHSKKVPECEIITVFVDSYSSGWLPSKTTNLKVTPEIARVDPYHIRRERKKLAELNPLTESSYLEHLLSKSQRHGVLANEEIFRRGVHPGLYRSYLPPQLIAFDKSLENSRSLLDLKDNWDGEGSAGYTKSTWTRARDFLFRHAFRFFRSQKKCFDPPEILPGPNGSIDLHWKTDARELLINVPARPEDTIAYYGDDEAEGTENAIRGKNIESSKDPGWIFLWLTK